MRNSQACRPCAKRKVRCDKLEPCSNCKRRRVDRCTYPASTPFDRVRQLESLVRELGGNPHDDQSSASMSRVGPKPDIEDTPAEMRSNDPMMVEEDGEMRYIESYVTLSAHTHILTIQDAPGKVGKGRPIPTMDFTQT
jgi:hypothetical protein